MGNSKTTFNGALYHMGGVPVGIPAHGVGRAIFVKPSSGNDTKDGKSPAKAVKTLAQALSLATANAGDTVYLIAESNSASSTTDYQSTALDWNKDGVHLVGIGCGTHVGQRSRIAQTSTVKTIEDLFTVSADNCYIANIAVYQGVASSTATSPRAVVVSGERNHFVNCAFQGNGDSGGSMDTAGARSLAVTGSENTFDDCYIGLDTVSSATSAAVVELASGATRNIFRGCTVPTMSGDAGHVFVKADSAAGAIDRFVHFKGCTFINAINSTATTMTAAVETHASLGGTLILDDCMIIGATDTTAADTAKVKILGRTTSDATDVQRTGLAQSADTV